MPWFNSKQAEDRKKKTREAIEKSRETSKKASASRDRVLRSLQEIEELIRDAGVQRGSDS